MRLQLLGARATAVYSMVKGRSVDSNPMVFYIGLDAREHFLSIAKVRVVQRAVTDFGMDTLSIPGFVPLPRLPLAWEGKVLELAIVVKDLGDTLLVASVSKDGDFLCHWTQTCLSP